MMTVTDALMLADDDADKRDVGDEQTERYAYKPLLRIITCGSVDDGKSTLIGRLLHDNGNLADDQLTALAADSRQRGAHAGALDYALLLDGLSAEREQGITIDVAYRHFDTPRRRFIVADCPGHAQFTRNMATGASTADAAVVLVDARKGLLAQTRRHTVIAALLGVRRVVLAVNKMDLVGFDKDVFESIAAMYREFANASGIDSVVCIPLSALHGDNLLRRSDRMTWYEGPSLLEYLETTPLPLADTTSPLRMPVQWVNRAASDFRGYAGTIAAGQVRPGDAVVVMPSGQRSWVTRVLGGGGDVASAAAGDAVTLTLADALDIGRGDVIAAVNDPPPVADQFAAHLLWLDPTALLPGRSYWLKIGTRTVVAQVGEIKYRLDVDTRERLAAKRLEANEIGCCNLSLDEPVAFAPYARNRTLGGFVMIDRQDNATVAAGMIDFALHRAGNLRWQPLTVDPVARARIKGQSPQVLWFTGLSGAGKSTIADAVEKRLHARGFHTFLLDGDNIRHGLNRDLGFTEEDRVENIRRVVEVARLMVDAGLIVLVSFISPFRAERRMARERFEPGQFLEIFVDTPLEVAEIRDVKGLYRKARAGLIPHFTGVDSPYEIPEAPDLHLDAGGQSIQLLVEQVLAKLDATR